MGYQKGHWGEYSGNAKWSKDHAHTKVTKGNYKASERDDAAHIDYLKRDIKITILLFLTESSSIIFENQSLIVEYFSFKEQKIAATTGNAMMIIILICDDTIENEAYLQRYTRLIIPRIIVMAN